MSNKTLFLGWDQEYETTSIDELESGNNRFSYHRVIIICYNYIPSALKKYYEGVLLLYFNFRFKSIDTLIIPDNQLYYNLALKVKGCKKIMIIRNIIGNRTSLLNSNEFLYYSFDRNDVEAYNIRSYNQFLYLGEVKNSETYYDLYYLGLVKNRRREIDNLIQVTNRLKLSSLILAKEKPSNILDKIRYKFGLEKQKHKLIDYGTNIEHVSKSNVIVDIVNENQVGLTLRVLEALFLNKKIITNNRHIEHYDFFDSRYIKIVDLTSCSAIYSVLTDREFLMANASYDANMLEKFQGAKVLKGILNECRE
ncbi:hypothetical protein [Vibrio mediterranei]|uniref:Uncharacterized protein n=1 Tax=Vibrio mediterranei TaxID=689 RepID=A0AAN1FES1_9VIBR|nr:hypothetical protein [Vibrio mediterranei]ASI89245.1 hypothetical protein BSZ05_05165 [Vibrio mediterranei]